MSTTLASRSTSCPGLVSLVTARQSPCLLFRVPSVLWYPPRQVERCFCGISTDWNLFARLTRALLWIVQVSTTSRGILCSVVDLGSVCTLSTQTSCSTRMQGKGKTTQSFLALATKALVTNGWNETFC